MNEVTNELSIEKAKSVIRPKRIGDYLIGVIGFTFLLFLGGISVILPRIATAYPADRLSSDNLNREQNIPFQTITPQIFLPSVFQEEEQYTWSLLGPAGINVATLAGQTPFLFAGTYDDGAFRSVDGGQTWEQMVIASPVNYSVQHIAAANPVSTLYAGVTDQYKIYRSEDSGSTWTPATPSVIRVSALAINPSTPTIVYAGSITFETAGGHVSRSEDGGVSWEQILPQYTYARDIAIDPQNINILYLGRTSQGGMLKSYNGGDSWEAINNGLSGSALSIVEILIDPNDSLSVYIATGGGLFYSANGGSSWTKISQGLPGQFISAIALRLDIPGAIVVSSVAGDVCYGVSQSVDGGITWQDISGNLEMSCVNQIISMGGEHSVLYAVVEFGDNVGQIWRLQE